MLVLANDHFKAKAVDWISQAPVGTRVEFKGPQRTLPQNDHMWAALTDIAQQLDWHGMKLKSDDWKVIFLDALSTEMRIVPNLDGNGFVNLGRSSSNLSKSEMSNLIELIYAFGSKHNVNFSDPVHISS